MAQYTIQEGDTLAGIALRYGETLEELSEANASVAGLIVPGTVIEVGGREWTVQAGDTLASIAAETQVGVAAVGAAIAHQECLQVGVAIDVGAGDVPAEQAEGESFQLDPGQVVTVPPPAGQCAIVFVNRSSTEAASYVIASGDFSQQGPIPPHGAAAIPPRVYDAPVLLANASGTSAVIDVTITAVG